MFHNFRISKDFHLAPGVNPHSPHEENFMNLTPDAVLGLQYWFKADDGPVLSGSNVVTWEDRSGNSRDAVNESPGDEPTILLAELNGLDVVSTDHQFLRSVDSTSVFDGKDGASYLLVWKPRSFVVTGLTRVFDIEQSNDGISMLVDTTTGPKVSGSSDLFDANIPTITGSWEIASGVFNGITPILTYYRNGLVVATDIGNGSPQTTLVSVGRITIGAIQGVSSLGADAEIAELIVYNKALNSIQREGLESYLSNKWGL